MFYRPAGIKDFSEYRVAYKNGGSMCEDVKELIERKELGKAMQFIRERTGLPITLCKSYCEEYATFLRAKQDYLNGKLVYVPY